MVVKPLAPSTSQVVLNWSVFGKSEKTVLHYRSADLGAAPTATALGPRLAAAFTTAARAGFAQAAVVNSITVTPLDTPNAGSIDFATGFPIAGGITGVTVLPSNVAGLISWRTGLRGRSYRGRSYIPGMTVNGADANRMTTAQQTGLANLAINLNVLVGSPNFNLVIVSYYANKALRPVPSVNDVVASTVRLEYVTQRRRMP